ncbi:MAG: YbjQ family protein [Bacteroidaceae bacterium]|nr:YbjQ family protein [Bacteroidaceae bacterium]
MRSIKLYTTPTVEGNPIEEYYGIVTANQVAGTGALTDFIASFSDMFGGNSGAYRNEMNRLYTDVIENISEQAYSLGGNAIVGVRVDFDNISAKNMSMFMVSVQGTAVKLKEVDFVNRGDEKKNNVTFETLQCEYNKRLFKQKLDKEEYLTQDEWKYILTHDMPELAEPLYKSYVRSKAAYAEGGGLECQNNFPLYVSRLNYDDAVKLMYKQETCYTNIIKQSHLFNASKILEYAIKQGDFSLVCRLLASDKLLYDKKDLKEMQDLLAFLQNLPNVGKIEEVKGGMFSSGGTKYVCQCGTKNDKDAVFCSNCNRDIKGFTKDQRTEINQFAEKVAILKELLN